MALQAGAKLSLHFTLRLKQDGRVVDSTEGAEPMTLVLGQGELPAGLEQRLLGLETGMRRTFDIPYQEAYGEPQSDALQRMDQNDFPPSIPLTPGTVVAFDGPDGGSLAGVIRAVEAGQVVVDFSHPLAGHDLIFEVEIVAVG